MPFSKFFDRFAARSSEPQRRVRTVRKRLGGEANRRRRHQRRAILEALEDRRVLASFAVITAGDAGSGICDATACTLRDAVETANATTGADDITFDSAITGTITLTPTNGELLITDPVTITGPGSGQLTVRAGTSASNEFRVIDISDTAGDVSIEGLTLTNGRVPLDAGGAIRFQSEGTLSIRSSVITGNTANNGGGIYSEFAGTVEVTSSSISGNTAMFGPGGGIQNVDGNTTLSSSFVSDNRSYNSGGGVFSPYAGTVTITDTEINNNVVSEDGYHGGGVYSGEGAVTISGSTISGNTAEGDAGGLYNFSGDLSISNTTISNNRAGFSGAGIFNYSGDLAITNSTISDNTSLYGDGGGVSNGTGRFTLTRSTISGNSSVSDGGGVSNNSGQFIAIESTLSGNTSGVDGGAIATISGGVTLTNSTVSGNAANVRGGGVQSDSAPVRLVNSTLTLNSANIEGGGIAVLATNDGESILIHNSIVAENSSPLGPDFNSPGNAAINLEVRSSLIGNNSQTTLAAGLPDANSNFVGTAVSPVSSGVSPLAANGGPTKTHALLNGGLAVDGGNNALALDFGPDGAPGGGDDVALASDQRGGLFTRFANGSTTDIGAFEIQPPPILTVDTNADVVNGNFAPGDRSLRELIELANAGAGFDTILFAAGFPSTITLDPALGPLVISDSISIFGPSVGTLSIQKDPAEEFRLLDITSTANNVILSDLTFTGGNAGTEDGGAIRSESTGNLIIVRSELVNNSAASGGAIAATGGTVSIAASTLANNTATSNGGAIAAIGAAASVVLVDSTVSSNVATLAGGGVYSENADVNVANSTVTLNTAGTEGGGIGLLANGGGESLNIDNSIIAGNTASTGHDFNAPLGAGNLDVDFSFIGDNNGTTLTESTVTNNLPDPDASGNLIGGGANPVIDPMLGALALNGGPTMTHNLLQGSLAIDSGSVALLTADTFDVDADNNQAEFLPVDQRGATRVVGSLDMGAVELAAVPIVTWNNPADITFGTALSATQLNATTTAIGTFAYTPDTGTILSAGDDQVLSVLFTPNNPLAFRSVTETVLIDVNKADPVVTWMDPAAIDVGTALSGTQLNATADIDGTFVYDPAAATVLDAGSQTLSVTFTPDDSANYNEVIQTATLVVNKIDPVVSWSDPAEITFGTTLDSTQLNATADVAGTFVYTPAAGTALDVGSQTLSVTFTPDDATNYNEVIQTATLVVNPIDPVVSWSDPAGITFGTALDATQLNATADVAGTFVYTPDTGTVLDAGPDQVLSVTFTPDSSNYNPITLQVMIDVAKADPIITWMTPDDIAAGTPLSSTQLNATASGISGTFVYDPVSGTILDPGNDQQLSVTFTPSDANYNVATAMVSINVIQGQDFGDAPSPYPVLLADNGARHATTGAVSLGANVDAEVDGQPSAAADGDGADDDGVIVIADAVAVSDADTTSSFAVIASGSGRLDAWIDFNGNGDWSDPGEQIATNVVVTAGSNTLSYNVPAGASVGSTAARFRISTAGGLAPTGAAPDGEVEDYIVSLLDGSAAPGVSVALSGNSAVIQIDATGISVNAGTSVLFSAPETAIGSLGVQGGDDDDTITLDFDDGPLGGLSLDGAAGANTLNLTGAAIDFTSTGLVSAQNFGSIDMSDATKSVITIDAATVAALSPANKTIFIVGGEKDVLDFKNPADWRLTEPIVNTQFVLTITNQVTSEVVQYNSAAPWQNPIQASDVNNSGTVTVNDALVIINELGRRLFSDATGSQPLHDPFTVDPWPGTYYDQSGDGNATALDALRVINEIARNSNGGGASEGEISIGQLLRSVPTNEAAVEDQQPSLVATESKVINFGPMVAESIESSPTAESPATKSEQVWSTRVDQLLSDEFALEGLS